MTVDLMPVLNAVLERYALPLTGDHGVAHWARVLENGLSLTHETGADVRVVSLFAVLHDSRRVNEHFDPDHGPRAALFAERLRRQGVFELEESAFELLYRACEEHTHERTHHDITVQTCFDADRLDIGRVGIEPDPHYLNTDAAKDPDTIRWADGRGSMGFVPPLVLDEWGIDLLRESDSESR